MRQIDEIVTSTQTSSAKAAMTLRLRWNVAGRVNAGGIATGIDLKRDQKKPSLFGL
jgi:hypothetical protein